VSLLEVAGLRVGVAHDPDLILRDVGFHVDAGEIVGLVGESGSGKTMAALAVMGILPAGIELRGGGVVLAGRQLALSDTHTIRRTAGEMTMIFQQPLAALNPTMRVGRQIARVLRLNQGIPRRQAQEVAVEMLGHVGIPGARRVARAYPHQLSGGMAQRVMIAMALACRPRILIADEPTTALDVTIQAQIFDLIRALVAETGCGVLLITHDLGAVAEMCQRVTVLYGGQVMETGATDAVFHHAVHPYTRFLLDAVREEPDPAVAEKGVDFTLGGCRFAHRCPRAFAACGRFPPLVEVAPGRHAACFLSDLGAEIASP